VGAGLSTGAALRSPEVKLGEDSSEELGAECCGAGEAFLKAISWAELLGGPVAVCAFIMRPDFVLLPPPGDFILPLAAIAIAAIESPPPPPPDADALGY